MTRSELDRLLEKTVAEALGVSMPEKPRRQRRSGIVAHKAKPAVRELHPA